MRLDVSYKKQLTRWSCSLACLEMVANFYGEAIDQVELFARLKRPVRGHKGEWCVRNDDVVAEARKLGLRADYILVNFTDPADMMRTISQHIDQNIPLIATQRTSMQSPFGHSRLIVGYEESGEDAERKVVLHDPAAFPAHGVPQGGASRIWKADIFAGMWKPNLSVHGGVAIRIQK